MIIQATIIINFRERWSLTLRSLDSIFCNTPSSCGFWLLDTGMPNSLREEIENLYIERGLKIIDLPKGTWPNAARHMVAPSITTPYAVFIDNDVLVMPDWLFHLVRCAEETGAGIVGPLYLWGKDGGSDLIHMAGGCLEIEKEAAGIVLRESHRHSMVRLNDMQNQPIRETCGFAEYHCLLMRSEVFRNHEVFDSEIVSVHEHIHASLVAREMGFETWLEPQSRVNYLAFSPWQLADLPEFRQRWNIKSGESSLKSFMHRWGVIDDDRSVGGVRSFLLKHFGYVDPVDPRSIANKTRHIKMESNDLQQTLAGLILMAKNNGYSNEDLRYISTGYMLAMSLSNGIYRPCGRPFINHLCGTASVLIFYGFSIPMVLSGLLHAAFSHGSTGRSEDNDAMITGKFSCLGKYNSTVVKNVKAYDIRSSAYAELFKTNSDLMSLDMQIINLLMLDAANSVDMYLSMEIALSGRGDGLKGDLLAMICSAASLIGLPALSTSLIDSVDQKYNLPVINFKKQSPGSFYMTKNGFVSANRH